MSLPPAVRSLPGFSVVTEHRRSAVLEHQIFFAVRFSILNTCKLNRKPRVFCCWPSSCSLAEDLLYLLECRSGTVALTEEVTRKREHLAIARVSVTLGCLGSVLGLLRAGAFRRCRSRIRMMSSPRVGYMETKTSTMTRSRTRGD